MIVLEHCRALYNHHTAHDNGGNQEYRVPSVQDDEIHNEGRRPSHAVVVVVVRAVVIFFRRVAAIGGVTAVIISAALAVAFNVVTAVAMTDFDTIVMAPTLVFGHIGNINFTFHRECHTDAHLSMSTYYSLRSCAQHQTGK